MHGFLLSIISSLIKLLWVFSSASKSPKKEPEKEEDVVVELENVHVDEKTAEIIKEVSKLDTFIENIQEAKSPEERLDLLIEFEEDEKMRELLIKMRGR